MPLKLVHRKNLMPVVAEQRHARRRHRRPVRRLRARRTADAHRPARPAGAGQPARDRPAHQDALRRRRRDRRGPRRRSATRRRSSCSKASRPTTARLAKQAQEASVVRLVNEILDRGGQRAGQRHPHRARGERPPHPLPHRRPAADADAAAGDQPVPGGDHQPHQDHGPAEHRREAAAAGRPHQDAASRAARSTSACRSSR